MSDGKAEFQISLADIVSAKRRFFFRHQFASMVVLLSVMFTLFAIKRHETAYITIIEILVFAALWFFGFAYIYIPIDARSALKQPNFAGPISVEWNDSGLTTTSARGANRLLWTQYWGWDTTARVVMLFIGRRSYQIIPRSRQAEGETVSLIDTIKAACIPRGRRSPTDTL